MITPVRKPFILVANRTDLPDLDLPHTLIFQQQPVGFPKINTDPVLTVITDLPITITECFPERGRNVFFDLKMIRSDGWPDSGDKIFRVSPV